MKPRLLRARPSTLRLVHLIAVPRAMRSVTNASCNRLGVNRRPEARALRTTKTRRGRCVRGSRRDVSSPKTFGRRDSSSSRSRLESSSARSQPVFVSLGPCRPGSLDGCKSSPAQGRHQPSAVRSPRRDVHWCLQGAAPVSNTCPNGMPPNRAAGDRPVMTPHHIERLWWKEKPTQVALLEN